LFLFGRWDKPQTACRIAARAGSFDEAFLLRTLFSL
jgi:hypothetical protein